MMLSVTLTVQNWMIGGLLNIELEEMQEGAKSVVRYLNLEALKNLQLFVPFWN
jgi:hypothetical protein